MSRLHKLLTLMILSVSMTGCGWLIDDIDELEAPLMLEVFPPIYTDSGPLAKANIKYRLVTQGETLHFDASGSEGSHYQWQVVQRPEGSLATFSSPGSISSDFAVDQVGTYQLQLRVMDQEGRQDQFDILLSSDESVLPRARFVVVGDFGSGNASQKRVGDAMAQVCAEQGCDFMISVGDNIYDTGINSVRDKMIKSKFFNPFSSVVQPFYMVLGNHDDGGIGGDGGLKVRGEIQIEYSRWKEKKDYRWQLPARYYRIPVPIEKPEQQPLLDLFALDTNLLVSPYSLSGRYDHKSMYDRMSRWLKSEQRRSKAQWQLAFGHHPYLSNGRHGNAGNYDNLDGKVDNGVVERAKGEFLKRFLEEHVCGQMPLWIAGHEHNLQDLKPTSHCGETSFIISGGGHEANKLEGANRNPNYWQSDLAPGFFYIDIVGQYLTLSAYQVDVSNGEVSRQHQRRIVQ